MVRSAPVSKLAGAASAALAQASARLAGDPAAATTPEEPAEPAIVPKVRADELRKAYRRAERRVDAAKEALAAAKAEIIAEMGAAQLLQVAETGHPFAELKTFTSLTFDQTRFRSEYPDLAAGYMKPQSSRRFRLLV